MCLPIIATTFDAVDLPETLGPPLADTKPFLPPLPTRPLLNTIAATAPQLLRALLWLLAGSDAGGGGDGGDAGAKEEVLEVVSQLAALQTAGGSAQELFTRHFTELLAYVVGNGDSGPAAAPGAGGTAGGEGGGGEWDKGSRRRAGFEALLRSAPAAVGSHLGEVMPIFRGLLHDATRYARNQARGGTWFGTESLCVQRLLTTCPPCTSITSV